MILTVVTKLLEFVALFDCRGVGLRYDPRWQQQEAVSVWKVEGQDQEGWTQNQAQSWKEEPARWYSYGPRRRGGRGHHQRCKLAMIISLRPRHRSPNMGFSSLCCENQQVSWLVFLLISSKCGCNFAGFAIASLPSFPSHVHSP